MSAIPMTGTLVRLRSWLPPVLAAMLLCLARWLLHDQLQAIRYRDLEAALAT